MNELFAKHRHSTEIIKTVRQEQKGSRSCSYIRHKKDEQKTNKSMHKHKINNEK